MGNKACFDFSGYRVAIAGGSRGIGKAMALAFAEAGADISICARGLESLQVAAAELAAHGGRVHTASCDLADPAAIENWVTDAAENLGGLDVLINNGTGYGFRDCEEDWQRDIAIDLMAPVRASHAALPWLRQSDHACILHTVSISALQARPQGPPYAATKAALCQYTTSQALKLAEDRIRVNAIAPGSIEFEGGVWDRIRTEKPEFYEQTLAKIPFGRFGRAEEIANAALFLASPLASWITGHTLVVDGGQLLRG